MALGFFLLACLCGLQWSAATLEIETMTTYVNSQVEVLMTPEDSFIFTVPTCNYYDNQTVVVEVYNPQNPSNNPDLGIIYFAITNAKVNGTIKPADIICSMNHESSYSTRCMGKAGVGPLYLHIKGNNQYFINFAINVTFVDGSHQRLLPAKAKQPFTHPALGSISRQELRQVVDYRGVVKLAYLQSTLIHMKICPGTLTTDSFKVTSILQADDEQGISLIAQAICKTRKCNLDTTTADGRIGGNSHNIPINIAESTNGKHEEIFVYAVAYNGVVENGHPYGYFQYGATISHP